MELGSVKKDFLMTCIGMEGGYLKNSVHGVDQKLLDDGILIRYELPQQGLFEHSARVTRRDAGGYALIFYGLDATAKSRLWQFIGDNLVLTRECPYCGQLFGLLPKICKNCGWDLQFDRPDYFAYREKMAVLTRVQTKLSGLPVDQLQKLADFVDVDLLHEVSQEEMQEFVGTSASMLQVFSKIRKIARTNLSVLILGESGTGKELTAIAIHERSSRKKKTFVTINCAAIPENLLEAELFGYEKGAFTGAYSNKKGKLEMADGGTVFLDEIGEMPMSLQSKLLRFLQDRIVERVGSTNGRKVDVRVIAATNCDLTTAITEGRFRNDLYYRLDEFTVHLPPVREREEDILVLSKFFLGKFSREMGMTKAFTRKAVEAIEAYTWPGNVREMINKIRRAIVMSDGSTISAGDLGLDGPKIARHSGIVPLKEEVKHVEAQKVKEILNLCGNNISRAAKLLKVSRPSLYSRIKKYNIDLPMARKEMNSLSSH
jgi:DNA-binding NtrC family response regulator